MATATKVVHENGVVHIICILDRSGSMGRLVQDVIGGFNQFLKEQKKLGDDAVLTLILFDNNYEVVYDRVPISKVKNLTSSVFFVRGSTALNDAIGIALNSYDDVNGFVYINTDGEENSSTLHTANQIKSLIKDKEGAGWEFLFAGVGIDGFEQGGRNFGLDVSHTATFTADTVGLHASYNAASTSVSSYRMAHRSDVFDSNGEK